MKYVPVGTGVLDGPKVTDKGKVREYGVMKYVPVGTGVLDGPKATDKGKVRE